MKANYHTHTTWCDGRDTPEAMARAAAGKGFGVLGFSSHMAIPWDEPPAVPAARAPAYADDIRALAARWRGRLAIRLGVEADYVPGLTDPDRARYAHLAPEYVIGSVHYVAAPDGALVCVDDTPALLAAGIRDHFGGSAEAFVKAYFAQERDMAARFGFDIVGHPDLVRKFNRRAPYFDESAAWYRDELARTADAFAASGKIVEVNTGGMARGWTDDAYPAAPFRALLRARGVRLVLSSDAHAADALDFAFGRFAPEGGYVEL